MSEERQWHSWVIKRNTLGSVVSYIREKCPEVDQFFYPLIKKEYETKSGAKRTKDVPMYEGYIFLRYYNHPEVFHILSHFPQITTYCGPVLEAEIMIMQSAQGKLLSELKTSKFKPGDSVLLKGGPFKGYEAEIVSVIKGQVKLRVDATFLGSSGHEVAYPEEFIERKPELQNAEVQNINDSGTT